MAFQILLNLIIAFIWMFLNNDSSSPGFVIGYLVGMVIIVVLRRLWPGELYLVRVWAIIKLLLLFIRELLASSFVLIRQVIRPKLTNRPGIFAYTTELKSDWEITILSCLICLTPGTLTLEVSGDGRTLYIHAMDIEDVGLLSEQIKGTFEKSIREVTRR